MWDSECLHRKVASGQEMASKGEAESNLAQDAPVMEKRLQDTADDMRNTQLPPDAPDMPNDPKWERIFSKITLVTLRQVRDHSCHLGGVSLTPSLSLMSHCWIEG
jgi:hypothetical protein